MRRIYWDTMLLIYLLEGNARYSARMLELLKISLRRGDRLFTSYLGLGELIAGAAKSPLRSKGTEIRRQLNAVGIICLPFDDGAVDAFADLRAIHRIKAPDAINLACAAGAGMDTFLTGDRQLLKLQIPGIHSVVDFESPAATL